jgi:hypothetical protein
VRGTKLWPIAVVFAMGVLFSVFVVTTIPDEVFFSGDAGVKALLSKEFSRGPIDLKLELPAPAPAREAWESGLYPLRPPFVYRQPDGYTVALPFSFALVCAPFYRLFGFRGFYLVPLLSAWFTWALFCITLRRLKVPAWASAIGLFCLIFASHVTLYATMFWEHTFALLLAYFGIHYLATRCHCEWSRAAAVGAGVASGLCFLVRPEGLLFAGAMCAFALLTAKKNPAKTEVSFASGVVGCTIAIFAMNLALYGAAFGLHGRQMLEDAPLEYVIFGGVKRAIHLAGNLAFHVPWVGFVVVWLAFSWWRKRRIDIMSTEALLVPCVLFFVALPFGVPNSGGRQVGPRYLVFVVPVLAMIVAVASVEIARLRPAGTRLLFGLLTLGSLLGVSKNSVVNCGRLIADYRTRIMPALAFVRGHPGRVVVITDQAIAQELEAVVEAKAFLLALTAAEIAIALRASEALGEPKALLGTFEHLPPPEVPEGVIMEHIDRHGGVRFYELSRP